MKRSLPVVLATLALIAGACGDDDDSSERHRRRTTRRRDRCPCRAPMPRRRPTPRRRPRPRLRPSPGRDRAGRDRAAGTERAGEGEELALATTDLGDIIVDDEGLTMYLFMPDAQGDASVCNDECADPGRRRSRSPRSARASTCRCSARSHATTARVQGTYNGWPLYYFGGDNAPGDVNGQGLNDVWWVIDASGNAIGA